VAFSIKEIGFIFVFIMTHICLPKLTGYSEIEILKTQDGRLSPFE